MFEYLFALGPPPPPPPAPPAKPAPPKLDEAQERLHKMLECDEATRDTLASRLSATLQRASSAPFGSMARRSEEKRAVDLYRQLQQLERQLTMLRQQSDMVTSVQRAVLQSEINASAAHAVQAAVEQQQSGGGDLPDIGEAMRTLEERMRMSEQLMQRSFATPVDDSEIDEELERMHLAGYHEMPSAPSDKLPEAIAAAAATPVHSK